MVIRSNVFICALAAVAFGAWGCDDGGDGGTGGTGGSAGDDAAVGMDGGEAGMGGGGGAVDMGDGPDEGAGGEGGEGGVGGEEPDPCRAACDRFAECRGDLCGDADLDQTCLDACAGSPSFPSVVGGIATCEDVVSFVAQQDAEIGAACSVEPPPPPMAPECDALGARVAECMVETCPPIAELGPGGALAFANVCNGLVGAGQLPAEQAGQLAVAPCDNELIAGLIDYAATDTGMDGAGFFAPLCEDGPVLSGETCAASCSYLEMCIPPGTPEGMGGALRDEGLCRFLCGVGLDEVQPEAFACFAIEDQQCAAIGECFTDPPPIGPPPVEVDCAPFAARTAACLEVACEPLADSGLQVAGLIDALCVGAVADGEVEAAAIEAVGPETPCDGELLAGAISYFTEVSEDDPDAGFFAGLCAGDAPLNDAELCDAACGYLAACIPPDADPEAQLLADADTCEVICVLGDDPAPELWQCIGGTDGDCVAVGACFPDEEGEGGPGMPMDGGGM